jgi:Protein of unknown function (DUF3313)
MTVKFSAALSTLALFASFCVAAPVRADSSKIDAKMTEGGLTKIKVPGIDLAYARPGASLAPYRQVKLDPVDVSFSKDWNPKPTGSVFAISQSDRERIRATAGEIVKKEFTQELQKNGGYAVVEQPGPGVLGLKVDIINLFITTPDVKTAGRSYTFASSAGYGTLVLQMYDSQSGRILARAVDSQVAQTSDRMMLRTTVDNRAQAQIVASGWARILRKQLDAARTIGQP